MIAKAEQKTKTCPYCGFRVAVCESRRIASAGTAYEASSILRNLKGVKNPKRQ